MHFLKLYANTHENAASIGWSRVPEYCEGNDTSKFVIHDVANGRFYFVDEVEAQSNHNGPVIAPIDQAGDSRTGTLSNISVQGIVSALGFEANVEDDPDKVRYSWGFTVDGVRCGVWDYKGSHRYNVFSTWGPAETLRKVFGDHYTAG